MSRREGAVMKSADLTVAQIINAARMGRVSWTLAYAALAQEGTTGRAEARALIAERIAGDAGKNGAQ